LKMYTDKEPLCIIHAHQTWLYQTENWIYNQIRNLPDWVRSHVVCSERINPEEYSWPRLYVYPKISSWRYYWRYGRGTRRVRRRPAFLGWLIDKEGGQILHSHFGYEGWANLRAARQLGLRHVVTFYGVDVNLYPKQYPIWRERYRELFEQVEAVLCEGPHMAECIRELGCPENKVRVHHLGISVEEITFKPRLWQEGQVLRVLIAASFKEKKGIPDALEALGSLPNGASLEITIIGDARNESRSQEEKNKIMNTIEHYGLKDKVRMLGFQPHEVFLQEAYKNHIFLSPSITASDGDTEGGAPVSLIEASASGMQIVSTKHCDIPNVVLDGKSGLLAEEGNVAGLTTKLQWLIDNSGQWATLAQAGREHMDSQFNGQVQGQKLAAIYQDIIN